MGYVQHHLTTAKVCINVWVRQPSHWHGIKGLKTQPVPPQIDYGYTLVLAQNHTQPLQQQTGMSVLRRQDGITPHLTTAKVCINVWDRQPSH